jgi:hypothetical protein
MNFFLVVAVLNATPTTPHLNEDGNDIISLCSFFSFAGLFSRGRFGGRETGLLITFSFSSLLFFSGGRSGGRETGEAVGTVGTVSTIKK